MKLFFSLFVVVFSLAGSDALVVGNPGGACIVMDRGEFINCVRADWKIPQWTAEHLRPGGFGCGEARTNKFYPDPDLPKGERAELSDYRGSGYDRGHQAPASSHNCSPVAMKATFRLGNMAPQTPELNRGMWRIGEDCTRTLADMRDDTYTFVVPVFRARAPVLTIGLGRVAVPEYFGRATLCQQAGHYEAYGSFMRNEHRELPGTPNDYAAPIRLLEELTGLNFFSALPQEEQDRLEVPANKLPPEAMKWRPLAK